MKSYFYFGADTYNCNAYGQGAYGECATQGTETGNNGGLAYTGDVIFLPIALAGAIIIASAILLVKKIRRNKARENSPSNS